jgi:iron complex transport system ATP-binding protein
MPSTLIAKNLTHTQRGKKLIQDISITFTPGKIHGILGPNGSGKTTLFKTIAGIWPVTSGSVEWQDENILLKDRKAISKIISLVPQSQPIAFDFSVWDIVSMGLYPHMVDNKKPTLMSDELIRWALERVDALHLKDRIASQLSQGEKQRILIARSLTTKSPIILLDEPTASLDPYHHIAIWQLLKELVMHDKIIVVAAHDLKTVEKYCDIISVLNLGRCLKTGSFREVLSQELLLDVFGVKECHHTSHWDYEISVP